MIGSVTFLGQDGVPSTRAYHVAHFNVEELSVYLAQCLVVLVLLMEPQARRPGHVCMGPLGTSKWNGALERKGWRYMPTVQGFTNISPDVSSGQRHFQCAHLERLSQPAKLGSCVQC
eukprot:2026858-Amphidinium_carterae.3